MAEVHLHLLLTGWYKMQNRLILRIPPQGLFVAVSSVSFLIPPTAYPARCGLLTITLLVILTQS